MRFYSQQHPYYCGIDLHTRMMFCCIVDSDGHIVEHANLPTREARFLKLIKPYREGLVVGVEYMFSWYWLADLCEREQIDFVLGHALYMRAIHGGKAKNDKIDSEKIALLLRGGMLPQAYVYPKEMRATRDLLRRRTYFKRKRAELLVHVQNTNWQYNLPPFTKKISYKKNRAGVAERFADPSVQRMCAPVPSALPAVPGNVRGARACRGWPADRSGECALWGDYSTQSSRFRRRRDSGRKILLRGIFVRETSHTRVDRVGFAWKSGKVRKA